MALLLNQEWLAAIGETHQRALGLTFPIEPVNAVVWVLRSFVFAGVVCVLSRRFDLWPATVMAWAAGFVLVWLVVWNLLVLPIDVLPVAVPTSLVEVLGAVRVLLFPAIAIRKPRVNGW